MALLDDVKELMPGDMPTWTDERINQLITEGLSKAKILAQAWNAKAALTAELVDISESGSTRAMSTIYKNAMEMAKYWSDLAVKEDDNSSAGGKARSRTHRAVRV